MESRVFYLFISTRGLENYCVLLLLTMLDIVNCLNGNNDSAVYTTTSCNILNTTEKIPCSQHIFIFNHSSYCKSEKLKELFPHLFAKQEDSLKFPGPVRLLEPNHSNITWEARLDGNIYFLKGFQIIQTGMEMSTFGKVQCAVIDISNITDYTLLSNIIFSIDFQRPGSYNAEVRSLPLGSTEDTDSVSTPITEDPIYKVYHPEIEVTLDYKQINQSCVNISLVILPEVEGAIEINIDTFYNGVYLQNLSARIPYAVLQYIPICDLAIGNYTMKISLFDESEYSDPPKKCLCYKGTTEAYTCQSCKVYPRTFHVTKYKQPISILPRDDNAVTIALAVTCPIIVLASMVTGVYVVYRRRGRLFPVCRDNIRKRDHQGYDKLPIVCVVYSDDNETHNNVVHAFVEMIEAKYSCTVKTLNIQNNRSSLDEVSLDFSMPYVALTGCDVIIVIHSEYMHYLVTESNFKHQTDRRTDDTFSVHGLSEIKSSPNLSQKTISVYFEYTDKAFVNLLASESLFYLPLQSGKLACHLIGAAKLTEKENFETSSKQTEKESQFISAVNNAHLYQKFHPKWLTVKLFNMQHSFSSDDSGIIITNHQIRRQRSVRSKSADTVCKCEMHQPLHRNKTRQRRHSFDVSFCPPDSINDDVSERLSLLESRLVAFNDRYDFIVSNNVHPDDAFDCNVMYNHNNV